MSVFHRVDDVEAMPARRFIDFALRLPAYKGVIRALAEDAARDEHEGRAPSAPATGSRAASSTAGKTIASDLDTLRTDPAFAGMADLKG